MLTTVLTNLQSLISPRFAVANFFPTLAFWFAHACMLFLLNAPFRAFARDALSKTAGPSAVVLAAALIAVAMSSYAVAAILPAVQSLMEGHWPPRIRSWFSSGQMKHFERLNDRIDENVMLRGGFGGGSIAPAWQSSLRTARGVGGGLLVNNYRFSQASAAAIRGLARRRRHARAIRANELNTAVTGLVFDLRANNADLPGPDNDYALEKTRKLLGDLIDYAEEFAVSEYRQLISARQFTFGALPLAPTRMGNVGKTIQAYAVERYDLNFELFWSRMQRVIQRDKEFGPILQAAKMQFDFLLSCSVLTLLWAGAWAPWLAVSGGPVWLAAAVALIGPGLAWLWYRAAVVHYRTFADVLRTAVDLFRFDLLDELRYPRPEGVQQEREFWRLLDELHSLYVLRDVRYVHPRPS